MRKVKIGLIGAGKMGAFHASKLILVPGASFKGIYDIDFERAKQVASQYHRKAFASLDDLCAACEAVIIASATETHLALGKTCLEKGLHVFIEKPLAQTSEEALLLVELAEKQQKVLAVGHIERFNPAYAMLKKLIQKQIILHIDAKRYSPFPDRMSAYDVVFDMMIHDIDLVLDLASSVPDKISATGKKTKNDQLDQASAKILMQNGILATIEGSRLEENKVRELTVALEEFTLTADLLNRKLYKKLLANAQSPTPFPQNEEIPVEPADQILLEHKDFVHAIRCNCPPKVTGEDGLRAIRVAEAIEESAAQS
ncbi:MAG: Gfo/Idh/MocA family oxidoreductase [Candidatus Margulisiibacteriota bacterium]